MPEHQTKTVRINTAGIAALDAFRETLERNQQMVPSLEAGTKEGDQWRSIITPAGAATEGALVAYALALATGIVDPVAREANIRAEAARRAFETQLNHAWKGEHHV